MRKSAVVIPLLALIAGGLGLLIRRIEINTAFEAATGFVKRGAPVTAILIAVSAVAVILAAGAGFFVSRRLRTAEDYNGVFATRSFGYLAVTVFLSVVWLVADVFYFLDSYGGYTAAVRESALAVAFPILDVIFVFLAAVAAISFVFLALGAYRGRSGSETLVLSVIPSLFYSFWLILLYKNNAANPVILSYAYACLAIVAAALSTYFSAGFAYKKTATGKTLFSFLATIFFCTMVLADNIGLPLKLIFGATVLNAFANCVIYLKNLRGKDEA